MRFPTLAAAIPEMLRAALFSGSSLPAAEPPRVPTVDEQIRTLAERRR